jgi:membrane associated rhomboid family serine protease
LLTPEVIDLNHVFLFLSVFFSLGVLGRAWRGGSIYRGWQIAATTVLVITALGWIFSRSHAGYVGGIAWLILLFLPAVGMRRVAELSAHHQYRAARKLALVLKWLHPSSDMRQQIETLRRLEERQAAGLISPAAPQRPASRVRNWRLQNAPAVVMFLVINVAVFILEISHRHLPESIMLHRLGALEPQVVVISHQYWRLFSALFLHAGVVHLLFNLFALYVLGPSLERTIGSARFCACYLLSGLGSSAGVVVLWMARLTDTAQLVGASGCIMGIVGAWAGFLLRHRHVPSAKQRLQNIGMIVLIQVAFDLTTPQVSMSAHLFGLASGFIAGLILAPIEQQNMKNPPKHYASRPAVD